MATTTARSAKEPNGPVTTEDLQADIARLKDDIATLTKQLAATGEQSMKTARRAASEGVEQLRTQGEATLADIRSGAKDLEAQISDAVREKPVTSLAIAAGVGFLFALFTRR